MNIIFWVTGAPNTGKSTFSDLLSRSISQELGIEPIRLDGDSLRIVLGESDINDETNRENLAHTYLRIAKYLALQGNIVIVSAVAPFASIHKNFEDARIMIFPVLLTVNPEVAILRNQRNLELGSWKALDAKLKSLMSDSGYIIENDSYEVSEAKVCLLLKHLMSVPKTERSIDFNSNQKLLFQMSASVEAKRDYWNLHYGLSSFFSAPSTFAEFVNNKYEGTAKLILFDVGCGDGRDSLFFSHRFETYGFDVSENAISICEERAKQKKEKIKFVLIRSIEDLSNHILELQPDIIYLRFVLHALNEYEENEFFKSLVNCKQGTKLFIETRTVLDPKFYKGLRLSENEGHDGHYRRFTKSEVLKLKLQDSGFRITTFSEGKGLSVIKDDDPSLLRVVAERDNSVGGH